MTTRSEPNQPGWALIGGFSEGRDVPGMPGDFWDARWEETGERIPMKDPLHGNQRYLRVCRIRTTEGTVTFAQDEVSNGIFLLAVPQTH